jgi:hypothetical protein
LLVGSSVTGVGWCRWFEAQTSSRQIAPRSLPDTLVGLHFGHFEQSNQHAELVASRDFGQCPGGLRNESHGLIGPTIARRLVALGTTALGLVPARSPITRFAQFLSNSVYFFRIPSLRAQL